jgi:hypothetical protein
MSFGGESCMEGGETLKRMLLILTVALIMAAMMAASALPALAQGPPTIPPGAAHAIPNVIEHNQAITIVSQNPPCVVLSTPGPGVGHHSDFPDGCSGLVPP